MKQVLLQMTSPDNPDYQKIDEFKISVNEKIVKGEI